MEAAESAEGAGIGAHHGVLAFGVIYALKALPEMLGGLDARIKADENETENVQESVADKFRCLILQSHRPIPPNPKTKQNAENLQQQSDNMAGARQRAPIAKFEVIHPHIDIGRINTHQEHSASQPSYIP